MFDAVSFGNYIENTKQYDYFIKTPIKESPPEKPIDQVLQSFLEQFKGLESRNEILASGNENLKAELKQKNKFIEEYQKKVDKLQEELTHAQKRLKELGEKEVKVDPKFNLLEID